MKTNTLIEHDIEMLHWHELVRALPRWADESQELTALIEDIAERGIDQPIICIESDSPGYLDVIDGRHRFLAAKLAGLKTVPVIVRDEADAPSIILHSLVQRRHYTKGALAYLSLPLITQKIHPHGGNRKSKFTEKTLINAEAIADELGFGRNLFFQARKFSEELKALPEDRREYYVRQLLEDQKGLGGLIAGITFETNRETDDGKFLEKLTDRKNFAAQFQKTIKKAGFHIVKAWERNVSATKRSDIVRAAAKEALNWPDDFLAQLLPEIEQGLRNKGVAL